MAQSSSQYLIFRTRHFNTTKRFKIERNRTQNRRNQGSQNLFHGIIFITRRNNFVTRRLARPKRRFMELKIGLKSVLFFLFNILFAALQNHYPSKVAIYQPVSKTPKTGHISTILSCAAKYASIRPRNIPNFNISPKNRHHTSNHTPKKQGQDCPCSQTGSKGTLALAEYPAFLSLMFLCL